VEDGSDRFRTCLQPSPVDCFGAALLRALESVLCPCPSLLPSPQCRSFDLHPDFYFPASACLHLAWSLPNSMSSQSCFFLTSLPVLPWRSPHASASLTELQQFQRALSCHASAVAACAERCGPTRIDSESTRLMLAKERAP
jgi:hypothetical protein